MVLIIFSRTRRGFVEVSHLWKKKASFKQVPILHCIESFSKAERLKKIIYLDGCITNIIINRFLKRIRH